MKRRVLTVTLALLLAVFGTVGVLAYVHGANARAVAGVKAVPALVAQQPIPAGTSASTALHEGLLASQQLPASSVPSNAVLASATAASTLFSVSSGTFEPPSALRCSETNFSVW